MSPDALGGPHPPYGQGVHSSLRPPSPGKEPPRMPAHVQKAKLRTWHLTVLILNGRMA